MKNQRARNRNKKLKLKNRDFNRDNHINNIKGFRGLIIISVMLSVPIILLLSILKPAFIGFVTVEKEFTFNDTINSEFTSNSEYVWDVKNLGDIKSIKLYGQLQNNTNAKVYIENNDVKYLILDTTKINIDELQSITGLVIEDNKEEKDEKEKDKEKDKDKDKKNESEEVPVNETEPINQTPTINESNITLPNVNETIINETQQINKSIAINLQYKQNTTYDENNDGIESITNIIDFTVENSNFNWQLDASNLCTRWEVYSIEADKSTTVCYGNNECCALVGLLQQRNAWNEPLYLAYNSLGATYNNIVSAQVIYVNESDFVYSSWANLSAKFEEVELLIFENVCVDTCILSGFDKSNYKLIVEVDNGKIVLNKINYVVRQLIKNAPPELIKNIENFTIKQASELTINLSNYFYDKDNDLLSYNYYENEQFKITVENNTATVTPSKAFIGEIYTFFIANDSEDIVTSNIFFINVTKEKDLVQLNAEVNKPVNWVKKIFNGKQEVRVDIPDGAFNISVVKVENGSVIGLSKDKIKIDEKGHIRTLDNYEINKSIDILIKKIDKEKSKKKLNQDKIAKLEEELSNLLELYNPNIIENSTINDTEIIIIDNGTEFITNFSTEAPELVEQQQDEFTKTVTITSDVPYENVFAYTAIKDAPQMAVKLYWIKNGTRELFTNVTYKDNNNNGLVDYLEWTVPHLSNQTFEINITILNVQSYPTVGGNWTVAFNTTGTGNLTVFAFNGTTYAEYYNDNSSTNNDLDVLELKCDVNVLFNKHDLINDVNIYLINSNNQKIKINNTINQSIKITSIYAENYNCDNKTGYWTVKVLTSGAHTQRFNFSGQIADAHNIATNAPVINRNYTIPTFPMFNKNVTIQINVTDADTQEDISSVNFTLIAPNGTRLINSKNGTRDGSTGDFWNSSSINLTSYGTWLWNISVFDVDGRIINSTTGQIILMQITATLNITSAAGSKPVSVFGHINLSNGTNVSNNLIHIFVDGTEQGLNYNFTDDTTADFNKGNHSGTLSSGGNVTLNISVDLGNGSDDSITITAANTIVNNYTYIANDTLPIGATVIGVNQSTWFKSGDEILIISMNGTYAGNYEFKRISGVANNNITLTTGLVNSYEQGDNRTQIVRVPNFVDVTINSGASITTPAWNGTVGGIIVFRANGTVTVNSGADITATGLGLAGGSGGGGGASAGQKAAGNSGSSGSVGTGSGAGSGGSTGGGGGGAVTTDRAGGGGAGCCAGGGGGGAYAVVGSAGVAGGSVAGGKGGDGSGGVCGVCTGGAGGSGSSGAGGSGSSTTYGASNLSALFLGSGGGGGAGGASGGGGSTGGSPAGSTGGGGGIGGGIIFIAAATLANSGTINANGTAGDGGIAGTDASSSAGNGGKGGSAPSAGGGGGSGGSIIIQVSNLTIGTIAVKGGDGGAGSKKGGDGGDTTEDADACNGAGGGAGGNPAGAGGTSTGGLQTGGRDCSGSAGASGGTASTGAGGSGGAGRIRLISSTISSGSAPANSSQYYSGTFISQVFDASGIVNWTYIEWKNETPPGTNISIYTRTSNDRSTFTNFINASKESPFFLGNLSRYLQYKAILQTNDSTVLPSLTNVTLNYSAIFTDSFGNYNFTFITFGTTANYTIKINTTFGNISGEQFAVLPVDASLPIVNVSINNTTPKINEIINITSNVTDNFGLGIGQIIVNDTGIFRFFNFTLSDTSSTLSQNITISCVRGCTINVTVRVNDSLNNQRTNDTIITVANTPPSTPTILFPSSNLYTSKQPLDLNVTFSEDVDNDTLNISYYINGRLNQTSLTNTTFNASDRYYILNVSISDSVTSTSNATVNFTIDTINPAVKLNSPANNSAVGSSFTARITPIDTNLANCTLYHNFSGTWKANVTITNPINGTQNSFPTVKVSNSLFVWDAQCTDLAGNSAFNGSNFTVRIDTSLDAEPAPSGAADTGTPSGGGGAATAFVPHPSFSIDKEVLKVTLLTEETYGEVIKVENTGNIELNFKVTLDKIDNLLIINEPSFKLKAGESKSIRIDFFAPEKYAGDTYAGRITFDAVLAKKTINVIIDIKRRQALFDIKVILKNGTVIQDDAVEADIALFNLGTLKPVDVTLFYSIRDFDGKDLVHEEETFAVNEQKLVNRKLRLPKDLAIGNYLFYGRVTYNNQTAVSSSLFAVVQKPLITEKLEKEFPWWVVALVLALALLVLSIYVYVKQREVVAEIPERKIITKEMPQVSEKPQEIAVIKPLIKIPVPIEKLQIQPSVGYLRCNSLILKTYESFYRNDLMTARGLYEQAMRIYHQLEYKEKNDVYPHILALYNNLMQKMSKYS